MLKLQIAQITNCPNYKLPKLQIAQFLNCTKVQESKQEKKDFDTEQHVDDGRRNCSSHCGGRGDIEYDNDDVDAVQRAADDVAADRWTQSPSSGALERLSDFLALMEILAKWMFWRYTRIFYYYRAFIRLVTSLIPNT